MGQWQSGRTVRSIVGFQSLRRMEGVKDYRVRSGLTPKASLWRRRAARRGRPGSGCLGRSAQAAAWWRWSEGPRLSPPSPSFSLAPDRAGRDCGLLAAPGAHTTVGFPAPTPLLWGKGFRAASDWLRWEKGGWGRGGWTRVSVFNFSFPLPLSFPPSFLFFFLVSLCLLPPVACSLRM